MHRYLVSDMGWLTDAQFTASIAIAQASPGPNLLFVTVMGWQIAGLEVANGRSNLVPEPQSDGLSRARELAAGVAERGSIRSGNTRSVGSTIVRSR